MSVKENHILPGSYGLVVCGGNSSRMGTDKSMITYHKKPQRYHVYEMLKPFCEKVYISCNDEQATTITAGYSFLTDLPMYKNMGPIAALLTAMTMFPGKNILFIGCDHPFLTATDLGQFLKYCKEKTVAAFFNEKDDLYEPLLAWYPHRSFDKLKIMHKQKQYSLQHFLKTNKAIKFYPENKSSMMSVDTREAFIKAVNLIKS